jgi:ABC-type transport system involved in multi-copper enzyme maturation permease subunit
MFEVFKFECRYQLRSPLFLILALFFFLLAFLLMAAENVRLGGVGSNVDLNGAWVIVFTQFFFSLIGMFAAIAIVSQAITRDYELKTAEILFATGISEKRFLLGRFFAGTLFGILVGAAAILGTLFGTLMPWLDQERLAPFTIVPFLYSFAIVTVPNFFVSSALFFTVAALTRSMLAAFVGAVGYMVLYIVIGNIADPEQASVYAIADPFGFTAFGEVTRYWTVFERNTALVPIAGDLLVNRIVWFIAGGLALAFTVWRYQFNLNPSPFKRRKKAAKPSVLPTIRPVSVTRRFGTGTVLAQLRSQIKMDLAGVFKSVPFYLILAFAVFNVVGGFLSINQWYGTPLLPVTATMLGVIAGAYALFVLLIIIYYSGEVVHRERQAGIADVIDTLPFPNGVMIASKIVAMWCIVTALLVFAVLTAMVLQAVNDYYAFEPGLYLKAVFFAQGGFFCLLAVLAVFVQVVSANKWLGMVVFLGVFLGFQALPSLGFEHALYLFQVPGAPYSDMNGYGHFWTRLVSVTAYLAAFCVILSIIAHLLFPRGQAGLVERLSIARQRLNGRVLSVGAIAGAAFVALGVWIFYNTNVLNEYRVQDDIEAEQAAYEKAYKHFEGADQPEVVAVDSEVDLYPAERRLLSRGSAVVKNTRGEPIREAVVSTNPIAMVNALDLEGAELAEADEDVGFRLFRFEGDGLLPGEEATLTWDITWHRVGFTTGSAGSGTRVVYNGTFVDNTEIMPFLGYNSGLELGDPNKRRELGLEPIQRLPKINDPDWLGVSQFGIAERTAFRTVFSTSDDQIAVAPGYLVSMQERDGRRFYTYEMDDEIWPFLSFSSARYEVARDAWNDVAIEIYHDAKHGFNVEAMIRGTKKSLDYFTREFSPYQYRQFRILEFPMYARFAQSFPNTIPYSEALGFVADLRDEHNIDIVFYVTAHELAHQWWGHQVAGARMQGMTVIVESLAQYSALMVMEEEYGPDKMRRFLRYELDRYLQSRGAEQIEELPLVLSENQPYIHYQKGSLVLYALKDLIGEDQVNLALRRFLDEFAYGNGPFPTALDLVAQFRAVAAPEHQDFITDLFEKITLYDLAIASSTLEERDGEWEVRFTVDAKKFYADGQGIQADAPLEAWVDIAVFPDSDEELEDYQLPKPLFVEKRLVRTGTEEIVVKVAEQPAQVGIDPYNKLIDRNPEDNLKAIGAD